MYAKTVTKRITHYQALGFTGEETRDALQEQFGVHPCLNTIYKHRKSPIGLEMLFELIRHQERDILKASTEKDRETAMKYRDKLIEKLMDRLLPRLTQIESHHTEEIRQIKLLWVKDESNPTDQIHPTPRASRVP